MLTDDQKEVLSLVKKRKNIFFTGSAGTGKSFLLGQIIETLRSTKRPRQALIQQPKKPNVEKKDDDDDDDKLIVAVTSTTGLSACVIGGRTIHSFAGLKPIDREVEDSARRQRIKKNITDRVKERIEKTDVVIIDEISMLSGKLFDDLNFIFQCCRKNKRPFGGVQMIVCGDFYQLPPVDKDDNQMCFQADLWKKAIEHNFTLTHVHRQSSSTFVTILNEIRLGQVSLEAERLFFNCQRKLEPPGGIMPIKLFPTKQKVEEMNIGFLNGLANTAVTYHASQAWCDHLRDAPPSDPDKKYCLAAFREMNLVDHLILKTGAQVMRIKNTKDTDIVNGLMGKVLGFALNPPGRNTEEKSEEQLADLLYADPPNDSYYPFVRFRLLDGKIRDQLVKKEPWTILDEQGKMLARRNQVPLTLAWAITIHKSQGQTLPWVCVDISKVFTAGQAYVALSRAPSSSQLQVTGFSKSKIYADNDVQDFYSKLERVNRPTKESNINKDSLSKFFGKPVSKATIKKPTKKRKPLKPIHPNQSKINFPVII